MSLIKIITRLSFVIEECRVFYSFRMYRRTYYDQNPYRYNSSSSRRRTYDDPYRSYNEYLNRYRHSNFDSPLYYGPSRYSTYPWDRDYNWRRRREDREERREESREERRDETREERRDETREETREEGIVRHSLLSQKQLKTSR